MNYDFDEAGIPTLELGLDSMNVDELKKLAALTGQKVPGRKVDIVALIVQHLAGERLHTAWERLDELQRAAGGRGLLPGGLQARWQRGRGSAVRSGQDHRWFGRYGTNRADHNNPYSIATLRIILARLLLRQLPHCPFCGLSPD